MPDADVQWQDVIIGAIGTAAPFEIGKFAISFYIGKQGLESTYGASASIVVVLIWVYLFGPDIVVRRGIHSRPRPAKVPV
jgi:membrane protein